MGKPRQDTRSEPLTTRLRGRNDSIGTASDVVSRSQSVSSHLTMDLIYLRAVEWTHPDRRNARTNFSLGFDVHFLLHFYAVI